MAARTAQNTIPTIKISSSKSTLRHVCHAESPPQDAIARQ
jgi:hypothetical protein